MKKIVIFFLYLLVITLVTSCHKGKQTEKPDDLISYDKMTQIISETYIIESILYFLPQDSDKINVSRSMYYDLFVTKNHITKEQYISSINYYLADKNTSDKLLKDVQKIIAARRDEMLLEENEHKSDTLQTQSQLDSVSRS